MCKMGDEYVIAKYDYTAQDAQELSLHKHEKLLLLDDSKHWWKVQNGRGHAGFVPSNFVQRVKPSFMKKVVNTLTRKKSHSETRSASLRATLGNGDTGSEQSSCSGDSQTCDNVPRVAKYAYQAQQADEITLLKGDRVIVLEKSSDGWWKGRKDNNEIGWFPSNYVETEDAANDSSTYAQPAPLSTGDDKSEDGCIEIVLTLYPYVSTNGQEELSFDKDETLEILEKPAVDPDWWKARNQKGEIGLIPRNYVQTLSTDSGFPQTTPESQSNSSLSGQSHGASSRTPSGGIRSRFHISGPFRDKAWYYGNVTRSECEHLFTTYADDGDFLIRDSETNVGDYTVTLKAPGRNKHFRVKVDNGAFTIGPQTFDTLDDLVEHYKKHAIYRSDAEKVKLYLVKPFTHPGDD